MPYKSTGAVHHPCTHPLHSITNVMYHWHGIRSLRALGLEDMAPAHGWFTQASVLRSTFTRTCHSSSCGSSSSHAPASSRFASSSAAAAAGPLRRLHQPHAAQGRAPAAAAGRSLAQGTVCEPALKTTSHAGVCVRNREALRPRPHTVTGPACNGEVVRTEPSYAHALQRAI